MNERKFVLSIAIIHCQQTLKRYAFINQFYQQGHHTICQYVFLGSGGSPNVCTHNYLNQILDEQEKPTNYGTKAADKKL